MISVRFGQKTTCDGADFIALILKTDDIGTGRGIPMQRVRCTDVGGTPCPSRADDNGTGEAG